MRHLSQAKFDDRFFKHIFYMSVQVNVTYLDLIEQMWNFDAELNNTVLKSR